VDCVWSYVCVGGMTKVAPLTCVGCVCGRCLWTGRCVDSCVYVGMTEVTPLVCVGCVCGRCLWTGRCVDSCVYVCAVCVLSMSCVCVGCVWLRVCVGGMTKVAPLTCVGCVCGRCLWTGRCVDSCVYVGMTEVTPLVCVGCVCGRCLCAVMCVGLCVSVVGMTEVAPRVDCVCGRCLCTASCGCCVLVLRRMRMGCTPCGCDVFVVCFGGPVFFVTMPCPSRGFCGVRDWRICRGSCVVCGCREAV
jgi:hypothetical protein